MDIARKSVENLVKVHGPDFTFPFDMIWRFAPESVPSPQRPSTATKLIKDKFIEKTGGLIQASSQARAGSPTTEYRAGARFRANNHTSEPVDKTSSASALVHLEQACATHGYVITAAQLANFYLALLTSSFVILAGPSGTGKSKLARLFAQTTGARFEAIPVQPQWSDNSDLLGYTPALNPTSFIEGRILPFLRSALEYDQQCFLVLLDEMNLAPVEHYFSDFLSVLETRRREGKKVLSDIIPLALPPRGNQEPDPYSELRRLYIPSNLFLVGTANMDETTRDFSRKVIDRAFTIELDEVDLTVFPEPARYPNWAFKGHLATRLIDPHRPLNIAEVLTTERDFVEQISGLLQEIREILQPAGISIGYRIRDAICLYLWYWQQEDLSTILPFSTAFDLCLFQKILPHVSGTGEPLRQALEKLSEWLQDETREVSGQNGNIYKIYPSVRTHARISKLRQQLEDMGFCKYWI